MYKSFIALSMLSLTAIAQAGDRKVSSCDPANPATCYPGECSPCFCLGPNHYQGNTPVNPRTCNGDFSITAAVFYWKAQQDGMEYAIDTRVENPNSNLDGTATTDSILQFTNLIDAEYKTPNYSRDLGFKVGIGYASPCDGWDISLLWTSSHNKAKDHVEAESDDNQTLLPLWSDFSPVLGLTLFATDIETFWKLKVNLVDLELGRKFWASPLLSLRPHIGMRYALVNQNYNIQNKGGSWKEFLSFNDPTNVVQNALNNEVDLDNDYKGFGVRGGLDSVWNFGCGWALYGDIAASLIYGRFDLDHDEQNRLAESPFAKTKILETRESFRASRAILDFALGIQWATLICDCKYGITVSLGWEQHLFFHQNQMWRVVRLGNAIVQDNGFNLGDDLPNNTGENVFHQRRGDLDTSGWTFSFKFDF